MRGGGDEICAVGRVGARLRVIDKICTFECHCLCVRVSVCDEMGEIESMRQFACVIDRLIN